LKPKGRASAKGLTPTGTTPRLWEVSVSTSVEAEDATVDLVHRITAAPVSSYHDLLKNLVRVSTHVPRLPMTVRDLRQQLRSGLRHIRACGLDPVPARITIRHLPATNWAESWKKHFPPLEIGTALLIRPEWIRRRPRAGQLLITLNPGLSFGTGHHPTTKFCLQELARARPRKATKSMLDIGSGSGLLAIAAAKLGYRPIHAFDLDPVAVKVARANARRNGVGRRVRIAQADLKRIGGKLLPYAVVCANLQTDLLLHQAPIIAGAVAHGGRLVLAGILRSEMAQVRSVYEDLQLLPLRVRNGKEWSSVTFERP